jgi:hypothetical protein
MMMFSFPRAQVVLSTFAMMSSIFDFVYASPAESPFRRATVCNGSPDLCTRSFGNVTFVGAHDSYAVGTNNSEFQYLSLYMQTPHSITSFSLRNPGLQQ